MAAKRQYTPCLSSATRTPRRAERKYHRDAESQPHNEPMPCHVKQVFFQSFLCKHGACILQTPCWQCKLSHAHTVCAFTGATTMPKPTPKATESIDTATMGLPGVPSLPGPDLAASAVVAPAAPSQEGAPKKDSFLAPSAVLGTLVKILPKTNPCSAEFFAILDAVTAIRSASHST